MSILGIGLVPETATQLSLPSPTTVTCGRGVPRGYGAFYRHRLMTELSETGPVSIWQLVNELARREEPSSREQERALRLEYWSALRWLLRGGKVRRFHRKFVILPEQEAVAAERFDTEQVRWRMESMCHETVKEAHRQYTLAGCIDACNAAAKVPAYQGGPPSSQHQTNYLDDLQSESVDAKAVALTSETVAGVLASVHACVSGPESEQVSQAARKLRSLPRNVTRRWTGWIGQCHFWKGRTVVLADGKVVPVMWVCRGKVLLQNVLDLDFRSWALWGVRREDEVAVFKNPAAVTLGKRKLGIIERHSEAKAAAARLNASKPPRPGSRPRGRPRAPSTIN